ncbi:MAG: hypothetical protein SVN78_05195 [Deferribacterota bacterium]|nr:hypothetical protein [Deferribacterota bacterium]
MHKTYKCYILIIILFLIINSTFNNKLFSQETLIDRNTLLSYLPDNATNFVAVNNSAFATPLPYHNGNIVFRFYQFNNGGLGSQSIDNQSNNINNSYARLVLLNISEHIDNSTAIPFIDQITSNELENGENACETTYDNITIDNYTAVSISEICNNNTFNRIYLPLISNNDYLLAAYADGYVDNASLANLISATGLSSLESEVSR